MTSRTADWSDPVPYAELSERQQEILQFLWNCPSPYSPSFREIGKAVGLTGPSAVRYQIAELERKAGYDETRGVHGHWKCARAAGGSLAAQSCREPTTFVFRGGGLSPQALVRPCRSGTMIGSCPWSLSATDNYSSCGSAATP
jgi:LexA DNA binding domain-containing protein